MPNHRTLLLFMALGAIFTTRAEAGLVFNGGFETGDLKGWTLDDPQGAGLTGVGLTGPDTPSHGGDFFAFFANIGGVNGTIRQTVATTPGSLYVFDFWLANYTFGGAPDDHFAASVDGATVLNLSKALDFDYIHYQFTIKASMPSTKIAFSGWNSPGGFVLDDVDVTPAVAPVPEPSSLAFMAFAALASMTGGVLRRKRQVY